MAQKTYKDIEAEANRRFGKGASREKFEFRRQQQEAAGLEKESKKRGGVAGAYDRNKALVQAAAPVLASMFIPGSAALIGGITGGLARGLDRPGKSGIGLDLGQAAQGALTGAALGTAGRYAGAKLGVPGAVRPPVPVPGMGEVANANVVSRPSVPSVGAADVANANVVARPKMSSLLGSVKEYAPVIQAGAGLASDVLGQQAERGVAERKLDIEEQLRREEQARRDRLAQLLMPMFQSQVQQYGQQRQG